MNKKPNVLFILADQLRGASLPVYGEHQIQTPNIDQLAQKGVTFTNAISTCPVCTPYRAMLLTGRYPQTTGHVVNFVKTRHDEIGIGDAFSRGGYKTAWVGKWHLHTGCFPEINGRDFVPEGRDRLGFEFWRGYNFHMKYFGGWVNKGDWDCEQWEGYETEALNKYAFEFLDQVGEEPFCLFLSPHQPHSTPYEFAPEKYYEKIGENLKLPENVPAAIKVASQKAYRHYLAMILALDDMVGELLKYLQDKGMMENTLIIFTSDHGTQMGAQGIHPWMKMRPYEESIKVPLILHWPGVFEGNQTCDALTSPVDYLPTLCSLCGIPIPKTVEGKDLSAAWQGREDGEQNEAVLTMNFISSYNHTTDGFEWRGVRTKRYSYSEWMNQKVELFDLEKDPLQMNNLVGKPEAGEVFYQMKKKLTELMEERKDRLVQGSSYKNWFDYQRRVIRNSSGELQNPEAEPDWTSV